MNSLLSAGRPGSGAEYGTRDLDRVNRRNGHRHQGPAHPGRYLGCVVPKLREGSLFPEWLLERRRR
ncbi:MAG: transposase [Actinomycetales bacterium]|nr:transposase [Actinomycetales bacterium]